MAKKAAKPEISLKDINLITNTLSKILIKGKFTHMKRPVEMVIGGLLLPYLQRESGESSPEIDELVAQFSPDKITKMLDPEVKTVIQEIPVDRIIETIKVMRGKFRRIKNGVNKNKLPEGYELLDSVARDTLIRWWNVNQRLIPSNDPVCVTLTEQIKALHTKYANLSSMQIAGYFSYLCRLGRMTAEHRNKLINKHLHRGKFTVVPIFSSALINMIEENWEKERADKRQRIHDHAELIKRREHGDKTPIVVTE